MPRYYFHVVSPRNPVRDAHGVELAGLDAAHWHAMHLVYRLREHAPETGEDWVIEVSDETGARPLVVLPRAVPMLREATKPAELGGSLSNLGGDPGEGDPWNPLTRLANASRPLPAGERLKKRADLAATSSRCRRGLTASAPENPAPRP